MSIVSPSQPKPPKLSVCVPTFNRAALLRESLEAIANQGASALFEVLEVLVSDNASVDNTTEVVRSVRERYPDLKLHYVRHAENIGMDRNLYGVVQRAAGDFVLVVSDDDVMLPGALPKLLALIEEHSEVNAFCLNMRTFQRDPNEASPAILFLSEDTLLPDRDACLDLFGTWITFLSIIAFRRSTMREEGYEKWFGTYFVLSYIFLDVLKKGALIVSRPYLGVRDNYVGGYNFFEVFVARFRDMMNYAQQMGYSPGITNRVFQRHLRTFLFPFLVTYKRRASAKTKQINYHQAAKMLLCSYGNDPFLLFVVLPLIFASPTLVRGGFAIRRLLKVGANK